MSLLRRLDTDETTTLPRADTGIAETQLAEWDGLRVRDDSGAIAMAIFLVSGGVFVLEPSVVTLGLLAWSSLTLGLMVWCALRKPYPLVTTAALFYFANACGVTVALGPLKMLGPLILGLGAYNWAQVAYARKRDTIKRSALLMACVSGAIGAFLHADDARSLTLGLANVLVTALATHHSIRAGGKLGDRWERTLRELVSRTGESTRKELLLVEARAQLERIGAGRGDGRYTGQILADFELRELIGKGGMAEVYEARHVASGTPAAIKIILSELASEATVVARFRREAEIVSGLDSPHIVRIIGLPESTSTVPYLVMERLTGHSLAEILVRRATLSQPELLKMVTEVAAGLNAAHASGIVHRDITPHNLFLHEHDGTATWKILDFGIARMRGATGTLTQEGLCGTPAYMPPEQVAGGELDNRADIYALGAVVYRVLTGRAPFVGPDVLSTLLAVSEHLFVRPSDLVSVNADVDYVLAIALAAGAADRFQSADELARALEEAFSGASQSQVRLQAEPLLQPREPTAAATRRAVSDSPTMRHYP